MTSSRVWRLYAFTPGRPYAWLQSMYVEPLQLHCPSCEDAALPPIRGEWADGSDLIADFTAALARVVCTEAVATSLERFTGWERGEVSLSDHSNLYRPKRVTKRTPKRVWLPYEGPPLVEMRPTHRVKELAAGSTVPIEKRCECCGRPSYRRFQGVERLDSRGRHPREPGKGLMIRGADVAGADIFTLWSTTLLLCKEPVKTFIEEQGYTNIAALEFGDIVS